MFFLLSCILHGFHKVLFGTKATTRLHLFFGLQFLINDKIANSTFTNNSSIEPIKHLS